MRTYGWWMLKNRAGSVRLTEIELEVIPLPSNTPVVIVLHNDKGSVRLVDVITEKLLPGRPLEAQRSRLPADSVAWLIIGVVSGAV